MFTKVKKNTWCFLCFVKKCANSNLTIVVCVGGWIKTGARYFSSNSSSRHTCDSAGSDQQGAASVQWSGETQRYVYENTRIFHNDELKAVYLQIYIKIDKCKFACLCISTITLLKILARLMLVIYIWKEWNESQADRKRRLYESESSSSSS